MNEGENSCLFFSGKCGGELVVMGTIAVSKYVSSSESKRSGLQNV